MVSHPVLSGFGLKIEILKQTVDITHGHFADIYLGASTLALVFVSRDFRHTVALFKSFDDHFLLDSGDVLLQIERSQDLGFDGPETVLAFRQPDLKAVVDSGGYKRASRQAEKFVKSPVKLAGTTD